MTTYENVNEWARTGHGSTRVFPAKERNAELSRKSEIVRAGSTEAQDKNVTGLRKDAFRPFIYYLEVLPLSYDKYIF